MSQGGLVADQDEAIPAGPTATEPAWSPWPTTCYVSGCPELDGRVLGRGGGDSLTGGVVGLSAEGEIGVVLSLQVTVQRLRHDAAATARLVTTLPVAHVLRLLKGVLKGVLKGPKGADDAGTEKTASSSSKADILGRVLISRIYGPDDLQAVLDELEARVPFQRLWSASRCRKEESDAAHEEDKGLLSDLARSSPSIVILTEMDHHFKWMRLQGHGQRLQELYGQLMRRLRALAAARPPSSSLIATPAAAQSAPPNRPLVFVLNSTIARRPEPGLGVVLVAGEVSAADADDHRTTSPQAKDQDINYRLALSALQQGHHKGRPEAFRLCCSEMARAQCIEPRYKSLMNYLCGLHVCFTRLPPDLVDLWGGKEGSSGSNPADSSLWVAAVESDEGEISYSTTDRIGVVHFARGLVQDASPS